MSGEKRETVELAALIDKIKREGIEAAETKAEEIIEAARTKASEIIRKGEKKAEKMVLKAETEVKSHQEQLEKALSFAGRDFLLSMQNSLVERFEELLKEDIGRALQGDHLFELLDKMIKTWSESCGSQFDFEILLSESDWKKLERERMSSFIKAIESGFVIKPHPSVVSGFRVSCREGKFYHDFTTEGIGEVIMSLLHGKVAEKLQFALKFKDDEK